MERQDRQGNGDLDISPPKKMQSVFWGKGGIQPTYPGVPVASATAAAATGSRRGPLLGGRGPRKRKSLEGVSKPALGRTFPSWEQRILATPLEPATLPPVPGILLLGSSKRYTLVPCGAQESKHTSTGKKSEARQAREAVMAMAVMGQDKNPNREPVPKGQVSRPGPSSLHILPPPTFPRTHFFTCTPSVHPSRVVVGSPLVSGSLGCQIGVLLQGTIIKVALWVC